MKAIHTYVPCNGNDTISKKMVYNMLLSTLLGNVFFDDVILYTTTKIKKIVEYIGIPYKQIIEVPFNETKRGTFSIPKLETYSLQTEPFIHIDLDSHLYNIDPNKVGKMDIFFSYPDMSVGDGTYESIERLHNTYLKKLYEMSDIIPAELKEHITLFDIPNFCVFGGNNTQLIRDSTNYCLEIYKSNKDLFDKDYYNACIIEQLLIPSAMKMLGGKSEFDYLYETKDKVTMDGDSYPFKMMYGGKNVNINNEERLYNLVNGDYGQIIHLNGYKDTETLLFLTREMIIQRFNGSKYIFKINDLYHEKYEFENISKRYYTKLKEEINHWDKTHERLI